LSLEALSRKSAESFSSALVAAGCENRRTMVPRNQQYSSAPKAKGRTIRIPFTQPYDWETVVRFLRPRAIPGLEVITAERYSRVFCVGGCTGILEVFPLPGEHCLGLILPAGSSRHLNLLTSKISGLFDCAADPGPINDHLLKQPLLRDLVVLRPGIRVPGAFDGFEISVRAVLGQQVTIKAATTMAGRLVAAFGTALAPPESDQLVRLFPSSATLAQADLTRIGLTRAKARAIAGLARAHLSDPSLFEPPKDISAAIARLVEIPGIGQWTAQYIAMRALRDPDGFPASDLGLRRAISPDGLLASSEDVEERASSWRPWRAYAAMHLWASLI